MQSLLPDDIRVEVGTSQQQAIPGVESRPTAFIGACSSGPVNRPTRIEDYSHYQKVFGQSKQLTPLDYALQLYFINGGCEALVVRVARNARPCGIELQADEFPLVLWSLNVGTNDFLRAAVDYDGIDAIDGDCFNLTVQRLAKPATEVVIDQEIYRYVSIDKSHPNYIGNALAASKMVRASTNTPLTRPYITLNHGSGEAEFFREITLPGSQGERITMGDVLGSGENRTGLFSLAEQYDFGQLYIPPLTAELDVGVPVLRAAARICARQNAMLIVDSPRNWTLQNLLDNVVERYSLRGNNIAMYYPRLVLAADDRGIQVVVPPGGAIAGALDKRIRREGPAASPAGQQVSLRGFRKLSDQINESDSYKIKQKGINTLRSTRGGRKVIWDAVALVTERDADTVSSSLRATRLTQYLECSIKKGLSWVAFECHSDKLWARVTEQVHQFMLECLYRGLLPGSVPNNAFQVMCNMNTNPTSLRRQNRLILHMDVAPIRASQFVRLVIEVPIRGA